MRFITEYAHDGGDWTNAFNNALEDLRDAGGGKLVVPAGEYATGPIRLYSHTEICFEPGSVVNFLSDEAHDRIIYSQFEGLEGPCHMPLIYAKDAVGVRVTGGGRLMGNGAHWWKMVLERTLDMPRPYFISFENCRDVLIEDVELRDSPCWTIHPLYCEGVTIRGVRIRNPYDAPNTDGIDPDGSRNVIISGCEIDVGDDCLVIKSGTENTPDPQPCENITVTGCLMLHGHGAIVIGSEMSGGVRNVMVTGCIFRDTDRGIRIKTRRARGGTVENMTVDGVIMDGVMCPLVINMYYFCGKDGHEKHVWDKAEYPLTASTPAIRALSFSRIRAVNATACAGFIYGLPESPVSDISITDMTVSLVTGKPDIPAMMDFLEPCSRKGLFMRNVRDVDIRGYDIRGAEGPVCDADESVVYRRAPIMN